MPCTICLYYCSTSLSLLVVINLLFYVPFPFFHFDLYLVLCSLLKDYVKAERNITILEIYRNHILKRNI